MSKKNSLDKSRGKKQTRAKAGRSNVWSKKVDLVRKVLQAIVFAEARAGMDPNSSFARNMLKKMSWGMADENSMVEFIDQWVNPDQDELLIALTVREAKSKTRS